MKCPLCGTKTKVIDTRFDGSVYEVYRQHKCSNPICQFEFYTVEYQIDETEDFMRTWKNLNRQKIRFKRLKKEVK